MLSQALIVAQKEALDSLRDIRSLVSSLLYSLMGPAVVLLVSFAVAGDGRANARVNVLAGMMSVFALVAAFSGGMNVAMDTVAGERERRSLLPLLLNPVLREDVVIGKWMAVSLFSTAGSFINLMGFAGVMVVAGVSGFAGGPVALLALALAVVPLALLAAAVQLLISTACRSVKEAQTYLSMTVFVPMFLGMFLVFFPGKPAGWWRVIPLAGQQLMLEHWMQGGATALLQPLLLGCFTTVAALVLLFVAANRLHRDEIVYGN
jgi:sodium transport system permease protein